jgi:predicted nucleotidyltransferase component of viral defense system
MISIREIQNVSTKWSIGQHVVEKDYALGWLLAGISQHPALSATWVFKGGTCLRKCYYETYRFSEDLDFTVTDPTLILPENLFPIFGEISHWIKDNVGIELELTEDSFKSYPNKRGKLSTQGKIGFIGPEAKPTTPKVKIDLASDELIASPSGRRRVIHEYSDWNPETSVLSYSLEELAAEKIRALAQRCRPRDLYDVVHLYRNPNLVGREAYVSSLLKSKSEFVEIETPTLELVQTEENYVNILSDWQNMLGHQLPPPLIPAENFWNKLPDVFEWLDGRSRIGKLSSAEIGNDSSVLLSPNSVNFARFGLDMNLLQYCAFNLVKIELYYVPEKGTEGWRLVESYSLRRTQDGNILLYVVNDRVQLRSYRLDRIQAIRASHESFIPKFKVEI